MGVNLPDGKYKTRHGEHISEEGEKSKREGGKNLIIKGEERERSEVEREMGNFTEGGRHL